MCITLGSTVIFPKSETAMLSTPSWSSWSSSSSLCIVGCADVWIRQSRCCNHQSFSCSHFSHCNLLESSNSKKISKLFGFSSVFRSASTSCTTFDWSVCSFVRANSLWWWWWRWRWWRKWIWQRWQNGASSRSPGGSICCFLFPLSIGQSSKSSSSSSFSSSQSSSSSSLGQSRPMAGKA